MWGLRSLALTDTIKRSDGCQSIAVPAWKLGESNSADQRKDLLTLCRRSGQKIFARSACQSAAQGLCWPDLMQGREHSPSWAQIGWWVRWLVYLSPMYWMLRGLAVNEFLAPRWGVPPPPGTPVGTSFHYVISIHFFSCMLIIYSFVHLFGCLFIYAIVLDFCHQPCGPAHHQAICPCCCKGLQKLHGLCFCRVDWGKPRQEYYNHREILHCTQTVQTRFLLLAHQESLACHICVASFASYCDSR